MRNNDRQEHSNFPCSYFALSHSGLGETLRLLQTTVRGDVSISENNLGMYTFIYILFKSEFMCISMVESKLFSLTYCISKTIAILFGIRKCVLRN